LMESSRTARISVPAGMVFEPTGEAGATGTAVGATVSRRPVESTPESATGAGVGLGLAVLTVSAVGMGVVSVRWRTVVSVPSARSGTGSGNISGPGAYPAAEAAGVVSVGGVSRFVSGRWCRFDRWVRLAGRFAFEIGACSCSSAGATEVSIGTIATACLAESGAAAAPRSRSPEHATITVSIANGIASLRMWPLRRFGQQPFTTLRDLSVPCGGSRPRLRLPA
jgi:hypothetical protein